MIERLMKSGWKVKDNLKLMGAIMEYRKATIKETQLVCDIVQDTKAQIYPHYYTQAVVNFFGRLHSIDNIKKDILDGRIDVLEVVVR